MNEAFTYLPEKQAKEREQMVFGRPYNPKNYECGGVCRFDYLDVDTAEKLMSLGYVDPEGTQNCSPTAEEMINFCAAYRTTNDADPGLFYLHGYVVSPERGDCRITFEGVASDTELTAEEALDFVQAFRDADNLQFGINQPAYCWYD